MSSHAIELGELTKLAYYGTTQGIDEDDNYQIEVTQVPVLLGGNFYVDKKHSLLPPEKVSFTEQGDAPSLEIVVDSWSHKLETYGLTKAFVFDSVNRAKRYLFQIDKDHRAWVRDVESHNEKITSMGLWGNWVDGGCLRHHRGST